MRVLALVRQGRALEHALQLGETTVLGILAPIEQPALQAARAAGAVRAVLLWDSTIERTDYLGLAVTLAACARTLEFDLVVAAEGANNAIGPAVADRLGLPHLSGVVDARVDNGRVFVQRRCDGQLHRYSGAPPLVLCFADGKPIPPAPATRHAVEELDLAAVALARAEITWRQRFRPRSVGDTG